MVWLLTGIWHGANWTFILWGLLYFVLLTIEKLTGISKSKKFKILRHFYTLFFVIMGWVLFRADNLTQAWNYFCALFGSTGILIDNTAIFMFSENFIYFVLAAIISTPVLSILYKKYLKENKIVSIILAICLVILLLVSVTYIVKGAYNPFIYFNF